MTAQAVTYADFTRGEYGDLGPRLPEGMGGGWFTGKNVMKYRDGSVGPRPGLRALAVTGIPNGFLRLLERASLPNAVAIIGTGAYKIPLGGGATTAYTGEAISVGTLPPARASFGNGAYVSVYGQSSWELNDTAFTVTARSTIPATGVLGWTGLGGLRLLAGGTSTEWNRLWYSDPFPAWTTFNDYVDVADALSITGIHELRNGLLIAKYGGNPVLLTGTLGTSSAVMRQVSKHGCAGAPTRGLSLDADAVAFIGAGRDYPQLFNGATYEDLRHLKFAGVGASTSDADNSALRSFTFVNLPQVGDWMVTSGLLAAAHKNRALIQFDDCRTFHEWGVDITTFTADMGEDQFIAGGGGGAGTPTSFYTWSSDLNRPAFTSDTYVRPGDASDTPFDAFLHLPTWMAEKGQEALVRGVIIDFRKWNTGSASTNHFEVSVQAMRRYEAANPAVSSVQTFDEAGAAASTDGIDARVHLHFGDQGYGGEAQVKINAIRGVAIRSVTMILELRDERT